MGDRLASAGVQGAGSRWTSRTGRLVNYPPIDYQDQYYYARPKAMAEKPKVYGRVDPSCSRP